jgi:hypothetical protein
VLATPWPRAATEASGGPDGAGSPIDGKIGNLPSQSGSAAMHVILMLLAMKIFLFFLLCTIESGTMRVQLNLDEVLEDWVMLCSRGRRAYGKQRQLRNTVFVCFLNCQVKNHLSS